MKNTGPFESTLIATAIAAHKGAITISAASDNSNPNARVLMRRHSDG